MTKASVVRWVGCWIALTGLAVQADVPLERAEDALKIGDRFGIQHYRDIELAKDGSMEIEGWVDDDTFVSIEVGQDGRILKNERETRINGPWGTPAKKLRQAVQDARSSGQTRY